MDLFEFRGRGESGVDARTEELAHAVVGACIEVHRLMGPGLPEVAYKKALSHELTLRGVAHEVKARVPVHYKGVLVAEGKVDVLVGQRLVVELKVVECLSEIHQAQALAYLHALDLQLALLVNFNVLLLKDGIKHVVRTR